MSRTKNFVYVAVVIKAESRVIDTASMESPDICMVIQKENSLSHQHLSEHMVFLPKIIFETIKREIMCLIIFGEGKDPSNIIKRKNSAQT